MKQLVYELRQLCQHNRDGSYATQANRQGMLCLMGEQLVASGYKTMRARDIKGRHVNRLLALWKQGGVSDATIRNRLAVLRWWLAKVGRVSVMPKTNAVYQLAPRSHAATISKAQPLPAEKLALIADPYIRLSLELQAAFGLRREEALKIKVHQADCGAYLVLQGSWCKGGRPRVIAMVNVHQRDVLDRAKAFVGKGASLIPADKTYKQQLHRYAFCLKLAGLFRMHGLRHQRAQERFTELAGHAPPLANGPTRGEMTPEERAADLTARLILSAELGHGRPGITRTYVG